jgi:lipopolysaccharide/colanic/teichoic acid biosynthesis glycosyltransferase
MVKFYRTAVDEGSLFFRGRGETVFGDVASRATAAHDEGLDRIDRVVAMKRVFDLVVAACAIAVVSPLMLIAALVTKLESPGPVLYVQERVGLNRRRSDRRSDRRSRQIRINLEERSGSDRRRRDNRGRPFRIYKFRTMVRNAEDAGPVLACENDPRITRFGRLMRKTRIDELPQFINVIKGDMSIIGPRPERLYFIDKMCEDVPEVTMRLVVKPGITGLAQVENGYTKTLDEMKRRLFYDLKYIADLSIMQEIKILLKTAYVVVTGKGAC